MATCVKRSRVRMNLNLEFDNQIEKQAFMRRLETIRSNLTPRGSRNMDNLALMNAMFDLLDQSVPSVPPSESSSTRSFNTDHGVYTGNKSDDDESAFMIERCCFDDLVKGLSSSCPCGKIINPWVLSSFVQKGHVARLLFVCQRCRQERRTWSSSRIFGGRYLLNQKMVHSFTCAGILPTQYIKLCQFSMIGTAGQKYIRKVYEDGGYLDIIGRMAECCMEKAVEEVKSLPQYVQDGGDWVITDARHDSTANAYHTTVPCISGSTNKILGISTVSRSDHSIAQTRELICTQVVVPQVIARGLVILEIAHDIQQQVSNYITKDLKILNSYDTWHGTKNVAKSIKKITEGRVRDKGRTWFPEIRDKRRSIKIHLYWAMKNCENNPDKLRALIENIPNHYQGEHKACHTSSPCHLPNYTPSKVVIEDPSAIENLIKQLKETYVYKQSESFCRCRDTYWVESFNHQLLCYLPKRIHFSTRVFTMRMNLAVMDWNENVGRPFTSTHKVKDLRRPDRRTPMKVLVDKTFNFVDEIWSHYVASNMTNLQQISEQDDDDSTFDYDNDCMDGEIVPESDNEDDD